MPTLNKSSLLIFKRVVHSCRANSFNFKMTEQKIVTQEQCCEILQNDLQTKNFKILECTEKSLAGEVIGIMADYYSLQIKVNTNGEKISKKYFVKRLVSKYDIQNEMIKVQGAYKKEKFIYDFLEDLSKIEPKYSSNYIPKCFLAVEDKTLVLEDLRQTGYGTNKSGDFYFDLPHLKLALNTIARLHAASIIFEHKKSVETGAKYKMSDEYSQYFKDSLYRQDEENYLGNNVHKASIEAIIALIDKVIIYSEDEKQDLKRKVRNKADCVFELVKESNEFYNVINHGDLWCNNILFKYDNDDLIDCKLIDFQAIRYTIPAHDFVFLLYASNNTDFINKHQEEMQQFYYNSLKQYLAEVNIEINNYITYEEFLRSVEYILPFAILQKAGFASMFAFDVDKSISDNSDKLKTFLYETRTDICVNTYEKNDIYKQAIHDAFRNLKLL